MTQSIEIIFRKITQKDRKYWKSEMPAGKFHDFKIKKGLSKNTSFIFLWRSLFSHLHSFLLKSQFHWTVQGVVLAINWVVQVVVLVVQGTWRMTVQMYTELWWNSDAQEQEVLQVVHSLLMSFSLGYSLLLHSLHSLPRSQVEVQQLKREHD